ncbi:MAG: hypothetical protein GY913_17075 [Proteobacteria bacterium]|nr:hypothetical protein [Pseudomonadota bacterium]MCP4918618.1 hypothetical protein [Pseudomonadota bacterium]
MLLLTLGCAINLAEMRGARVLRGGEIEVSEINSVVIPSAAVREAIDPAKELVGQIDESDQLTAEEREVLVGGMAAVALSGPGYGTFIDGNIGLGRGFEANARVGNGSYTLGMRKRIPLYRAGAPGPWHMAVGVRGGLATGGAWLGIFNWANKAIRVSELRRYDLAGTLTVGREFAEWGRVWWGPKVQVSPYSWELDGTLVGLGAETSTGRLLYAGGFAGGSVGYRWIHLAGELTVVHTRGSLEAFGEEHSQQGWIVAPHWGVQVTF